MINLFASFLLAANPVQVAVTIDDLPFVGDVAPHDSVDAATQRILDALALHHAPATAFVNCRSRSASELHTALQRWRDAKIPLGNHTDKHKHVDAMPLGDWLKDVDSCGAALKKDTGSAVEWFRFPMLREGRTPEARDAAAAALKKRGYKNAQVSIDTSDWGLVQPYIDALTRQDTADINAIGQTYVQHMLHAAQHYREAARTQVGHDIKHVLLLHANALNADWLTHVLTALEKDGFTFITLKEALADPIYKEKEQYTGGIGLSWIYRIAPNAADRWQWDATQLDAMRLVHGGDTLDISEHLTIRRVSTDTYVVVDDLPHPANSVVAMMPDGAALFVGSPYDPKNTQDLIDWVKETLQPKALVLVDTHFHYDGGTGGNATFAAAGARVIGADATAALVKERGAKMVQGMVAFVDDTKQKARFEGFAPSAPTETFPLASGLTLRFGDEEARVVFPGRAHSPDNVVVWFPKRDLLVGGCAVVGMPKMGNLSDADLAAWPAALEVMRAFKPHVVIPGHDKPGDIKLLDHTLDLVIEASQVN